MAEGSLEAPTRYPLDWHNVDFYDEEKLDHELRRVFDICHGCRRCFNLCNSFPTLFDLIDSAETEELDSVNSADFKKVADNCTLCDMCFLTKCPYVPPHEFNLDFPHLILRYRAVEHKKGQIKKCHTQLTKTDRNGKIGVQFAKLINMLSRRKNKFIRLVMQYVMGLSAKARLPKFASRSLLKELGAKPVGRVGSEKKVALFVGCHCNYSDTQIGKAAVHIFEKFGVHCELVYPECCGMPQIEVGNLPVAAQKAQRISKVLRSYIDRGYDVVGLTPSCSLLMKFEWVLLLPENEDCLLLSQHCYDISEYIVGLAKGENLPKAEKVLSGGISFHVACHARAQNMGQKGVELLRLLPEADIKIVERCSGHGGAWGVMDDNFDISVKVGRPAARAMSSYEGVSYVTSECPLAALHLGQIIEDGFKNDGFKNDGVDVLSASVVAHPLILLARAYGMEDL